MNKINQVMEFEKQFKRMYKEQMKDIPNMNNVKVLAFKREVNITYDFLIDVIEDETTKRKLNGIRNTIIFMIDRDYEKQKSLREELYMKYQYNDFEWTV